MTMLAELRRSVIEGRTADVERLIQRGLAESVPAGTLLNEGLVAGMTEVGGLFDCGEFYVPEMLVSARAMRAGLALLRPMLVESSVRQAGRVAIGTVQGDLHDIGKNLVAMMLEGTGFVVTDLGADVPIGGFVEAARSGPDIIAISALLTTTMTQIPHIIEALKAAGLRERAKVIVGGAPLTEAFAERVGADGYAPDASRAVRLARQLVGVA